MKNIPICVLAVASLLIYSSCKKQSSPEEAIAGPGELVTEACTTQYLQLSLDPSTTNSYLFMITNSPGNAPVTAVPVNGSAGNNIIGSASPGPVDLMTGISFAPAGTGGTCYGITGAASATPNSLIIFSSLDPNIIATTPLTSATGTPLDMSDIERNPWNGRYYAINRATNKLATINVGTGVVTDLSPMYSFKPTGLAVNCVNGNIYLVSMTGPAGDVYVASPLSGVITAGPCPYPGVIDPTSPPDREMGLHYDCACTNRLVTGNYTGTVTSILLTDGLPGCLGGPVYASLSGPPIGFHSTVDFSGL